MREAIERVIAELEEDKKQAIENQKHDDSNFAFKHWGVEVGIVKAIKKLKEVLADETDNPGDPSKPE